MNFDLDQNPDLHDVMMGNTKTDGWQWLSQKTTIEPPPSDEPVKRCSA